MLDTKALADATALIVKQHVSDIVAPLLKRIEQLEARQPEKGEKGEAGERGQDGKDGDAGQNGVDGLNGKDGRDGADAVVNEAEIVAKVLASIEPPKDGRDGRDGVDGKDFDPAVLDKAVSDAFNRLEKPKDGRDGVPGKDGRDGLDAVKFIRDAGGNLVAVMSNGTTCDLGEIQGRDGEPGRDGMSGKDGLDGIGFDDMDFEVREDGCYIVFIKGEIEKEARLPIPIDRGVYKEGQTYRKGDGVTWGGSFWFAQEETTEKPDSGKGWRLSVKKGRDGKDADGKGSTKPVKG